MRVESTRVEPARVGPIAGIASEAISDQENADDDLAEQLLHGCGEVEDHAADDPQVAVEYLGMMRERVAGRDGA